jgi:hypothetical protein
MGFEFVIGVTEHLQIVTTSNCSKIVNPNALQFITARTKTSHSSVSSQSLPGVSAPVFTSFPTSDCPIPHTLLKLTPRLGPHLTSTSYSYDGLLEVKVTLRPTISQSI